MTISMPSSLKAQAKPIAIQGVKALTPTGWLEEATILCEEGKILSIGQAQAPQSAMCIDGVGLTALPGIIDVHGDAFERSICPRPGTHFSLEMALPETDRHLLASGITTYFYSITHSFEPGLRSRDMTRSILDFVLGEKGQNLLCNNKIHIRHEIANVDGLDALFSWMEQGLVHLLSLGDHLPPSGEGVSDRQLRSRRLRLKMPDSDIVAMLERALSQREQGVEAIERMIQAAQAAKIPLASHDDDSIEKVTTSARRGVSISEFPTTVDLAQLARQNNASVLMGAPNLVRGGSHLGNMGVSEAAREGVLDMLCSDYHFPSLFQAPFLLAANEGMAFEDAWATVSQTPAEAAGLGHCKGKLAQGYDADLLLLDLKADNIAQLKSVYVRGRAVVQYA